MATVIVFQHGQMGPGRFGVTLRDLGFKLDIRRPHLAAGEGGAPVPPDLDNVSGVLVLGGSQNVTDIATCPWMQAEAEFLKKAHERGLPVIGLCLGAQLIAHALGGQVAYKEGNPELGFVPVSLTIPAQTETVLAGIPWNHSQPFSCEQEVKTLPPGATLLMTSRNTKHVAYRVGMRTYGFLFHPECDRPLLDTMWNMSSSWFPKVGTSAAAISQQTDAHYPNFARVADRLALNLATYCFSYRKLLSA